MLESDRKLYRDQKLLAVMAVISIIRVTERENSSCMVMVVDLFTEMSVRDTLEESC